MKKYEKSIHSIGEATVYMANDGGKDYLFSTDESLGFIGKRTEAGIQGELSHENAVVLRKLFPFTAPMRVLNKKTSFGVGDRLGIATAGHIKVFEQYNSYPVLVQQSIRELNLTHRTYEEVLDCVTFAVFKAGYQKGFGADGDHLKTEEDIRYALSLGFTMITLDCSEYIKSTTDAVGMIPKEMEEKYLSKSFELEEGILLKFEEEELRKICTIYNDAIAFATTIYHTYLKDANADFEISIDETSTTTSPMEHFYVAKELRDRGVQFATIAPRFCGEFQKGIDYIGALDPFEKEIRIHAAIARHFGYKLSIHSGSDKFRIFPIIAKATKGNFHVKTAGTNWLEAMRVVALKEATLYREIHQFALLVFQEATAYYHVTADVTKIPDVNTIKDEDLPGLFDQNDARQLIHITYGLILDRYREELYEVWKNNEAAYEEALVRHISKHLDLLKVTKKEDA